MGKKEKRQNCWEFKKCGRQSGGEKIGELGLCPVCIEIRLDQANSGKNAGRACWVVAGTKCHGKVQGSYTVKISECMKCDFYRLVKSEEGTDYQSSKQLLARLKSK